jgi:ATP-dependent helicase HrpA
VNQASGAPDPRLEQFRWLLEELRVQLSLGLKTPLPVSVSGSQDVGYER